MDQVQGGSSPLGHPILPSSSGEDTRLISEKRGFDSLRKDRRHRPCGRLGPSFNWENAGLASRRSGFESLWFHRQCVRVLAEAFLASNQVARVRLPPDAPS